MTSGPKKTSRRPITFRYYVAFAAERPEHPMLRFYGFVANTPRQLATSGDFAALCAWAIERIAASQPHLARPIDCTVIAFSPITESSRADR